VIAVGAMGCGQDYNSNSNDGELNTTISCPTDANLCTAYAVIKANHCFECHSWSGYLTDAAWKSAGLVQAGNPSSSLLILQLKNSGGTMPENYSPLSSSDLQSLKTWIQGMQ
jgi:hypothetical protein